jgi:hypothetical protein
MANFVRLARSSDDWTTNELFAFNIEVQHATAAAFFKTTDLPEASVSETILDDLQEPDGPLSKTDRKFFQYMQVAERAGFEPVTSDFTVFLLSLLDYDHDARLLRTNNVMPFYMAGKRVEAKADVVLMDGDSYLLVVQEEKVISQLAVAPWLHTHSTQMLQRVARGDDPEPRLIAGCIAAANMNNFRRKQSGLPPLDRQVIPGIIMFGTVPIFYRTTVTAAFMYALGTSTYPSESTIVLMYIPPAPNPANYIIRGIRPLENRRVVFQCLEAFKAL